VVHAGVFHIICFGDGSIIAIDDKSTVMENPRAAQGQLRPPENSAPRGWKYGCAVFVKRLGLGSA
jgi:hypothetical protein